MTMKKDEKFVEITPKEHYCGLGACPSVFKNDKNEIVVVGKFCQKDDLPENIINKVGEGESAVVVPAGLIEELE